MENKHIEICGEVFDLNDPDGKKAAVRAWLQARARERKAPAGPGHTASEVAAAEPENAPAEEG